MDLGFFSRPYLMRTKSSPHDPGRHGVLGCVQRLDLLPPSHILSQVEKLIAEVERIKSKDPVGYIGKAPTKRLAAIAKLMLIEIPEDPTRKKYLQGSTLGKDLQHWRRAKFFQQYRLFFRFHAPSKKVVLAWVNDSSTRRAYRSRTDAYRVFQDMLDKGQPPDDWHQLLEESTDFGQSKSVWGLHKLVP